MSDPMISCQEFIRTLADFLAGELPKDQHERGELHLKICPYCVDYLKSYQLTIKLGAEAMREEEENAESAELPEGLVEVILAGKGR